MPYPDRYLSFCLPGQLWYSCLVPETSFHAPMEVSESDMSRPL